MKNNDFVGVFSVVSCDPPVAPLNGYKNVTSQKFGDSVSFQCNQGFQMIGSASITCMATGKWSGNAPTCDVISCDPPLVPRHGSLRSRSTRYSSTVVFNCDDGYVLDGPAVLQCEGTGYWNGTEPRCKGKQHKTKLVSQQRHLFILASELQVNNFGTISELGNLFVSFGALCSNSSLVDTLFGNC